MRWHEQLVGWRVFIVALAKPQSHTVNLTGDHRRLSPAVVQTEDADCRLPFGQLLSAQLVEESIYVRPAKSQSQPQVELPSLVSSEFFAAPLTLVESTPLCSLQARTSGPRMPASS